MNNTLTKQQPKLSVRKPGHWRNKWEDYGKVFFGYGYWSSAEIAEQKATEYIERLKRMRRSPDLVARYLGAFFFPEEGDGQ